MLFDDSTASQTFELYGPKNYSTAEIAEMVDREIFKKRTHVNVPKAILKPIAKLANRIIWWPVLSGDEVEREFIDQKIDQTAKTFADLGIEPGDISNFTYHYLVRGSAGDASWRNRAWLTLYSKDSGARHTTISLRRLKRKRGRRKSTCMSQMSCRRVFACSVDCIYHVAQVTRCAATALENPACLKMRQIMFSRYHGAVLTRAAWKSAFWIKRFLGGGLLQYLTPTWFSTPGKFCKTSP